MTAFKKREVQRTRTLGERLRKVREEANISLKEAAEATQISKDYLAALEDGNYSHLPGPVYIESFLKKYATFLKVSSDFVLELYDQQEKKVLQHGFKSNFFTPKSSVPKLIITPKLNRSIIIGMIITACLVYVGFEISNIFSPPDLIVLAPEDLLTVQQTTIVVSGSTMPEALLTINGKEVILEPNGSFSASVNLTEGINEIKISAAKEHSKEMTVVRRVLFEPSGE